MYVMKNISKQPSPNCKAKYWKRSAPYPNETHITENQNIIDPNAMKLMLTLEDKINLALITKIMTEKKTTSP